MPNEIGPKWGRDFVKKGVLNHCLFAVFFPQGVLNNSIGYCRSDCNPHKNRSIVKPALMIHQYSYTISMILCRLFIRLSESWASGSTERGAIMNLWCCWELSHSLGSHLRACALKPVCGNVALENSSCPRHSASLCSPWVWLAASYTHT